MSSQQAATGRFCDDLQLTGFGIWCLSVSPVKEHGGTDAFVAGTDHKPGVLLTLLDPCSHPERKMSPFLRFFQIGKLRPGNKQSKVKEHESLSTQNLSRANS